MTYREKVTRAVLRRDAIFLAGNHERWKLMANVADEEDFLRAFVARCSRFGVRIPRSLRRFAP